MPDTFDIQEFPAGYDGRKTYVRVVGHTGLVASCYVYSGGDGRYHLHPDFGGTYEGAAARSDNIAAPQLMRSIGQYKSTVDGSVISSRYEHNEHLKRHNLIEVGNEPIGNMSRPEPVKVDREARQRIKHHLDTVKAMPQKQYNDQVAKVHANGH